MKSLYNIVEKGKSIYKHIVSSMFDSNNPETAVEHLLKSIETDPGNIVSEQGSHQAVYSSLYNAPSDDFYMESEKVMYKRANDNVETKHIDEDIIPSNVELEVNTNGKDHSIDEDLILPKVKLKDNNTSGGNQWVDEIVHLLEDLNRLNAQTEDENVKSTIMYCEDRIVEILLSNGCERIENDSLFDNSRHVPSPFSFLPNGCTIDETVKPGLSYNGKILIKAIVKCKK